ncbi:MAG: hypothetical protein R8K48_07550 [Gallionella sp.]
MVKNMTKSLGYGSKTTIKTLALISTLAVLVLSGCGPRGPDGTFLILELENTDKIKQYSVFNPYVKSIKKCQASAKIAIAQVLASVPNVLPKDSKITSWRCSFMGPERGG